MSDRINFYCVYRRNDDLTIILEDADREYLRMTGIRKCGKNIRDIYGEEYACFVSNLFETVAPGESIRFIRNDPSDLRYVTVLRDREFLRCVGIPIRDAASQLKAQTDDDYAYVGTIVAEKQNGKYIITDCSDRMTTYFVRITRGAVLEDAVRSHTYAEQVFYMPVFDSEHPVEFCIPLKRFESRQMWYCKINMTPLVTRSLDRMIITVSRCLSERIDGASFCELGTDEKNIYINKMDYNFAALLSEGRVNPEDIFRNVNSGSSPDYDSVIKLADIKNGGEYTFYSFPADKNKLSGTVISTPKPLPSKKLSVREFEVLTLAAKGNTSKYIACLLGVKEGTVKKTLHNGFVKLGISSRAELAEFYRNSDKIKNFT